VNIYVRAAIAAALGLLAPIAAIIAGEPVQQIKGMPTIGWVATSGLAVVLYCTIVQFSVAQKGHGLAANWPALVAMLLSLTVVVGFLTLIVYVAHPDHVRYHVVTSGLPMLVSGCLGGLLGTVLAARVRRQAIAGTAHA
jgi:hypothetical protein